MDVAGYDSKYATLYWPWIKVFDPVAGQARFVPPSGHVAGLWSRTDTERGVHKAPANDVLRGVVEVQNTVTKGEQDLLNPVLSNAERSARAAAWLVMTRLLVRFERESSRATAGRTGTTG